MKAKIKDIVRLDDSVGIYEINHFAKLIVILHDKVDSCKNFNHNDINEM